MAYGAPEGMLGVSALKEMARHYRLPMFHFAGCSDAKTFDQQATIEGALWIMMAALSGGNLVHDVGYIDNGLTTSYAHLVTMDEVIGMVARFMGGIVVNPETLAQDVIDRVGPGGHFMSDDHTLAHFRDNWVPTLLDRANYTNWAANGRLTLGDRAAARARDLLEKHRPAALDAGVAERLAALVARAEARAVVPHAFRGESRR
jgi:trimethylamine--corrinoid protein Co-methyltransferase